jgi:3-oxoacyl-[acyl-carrier protein] reductase
LRGGLALACDVSRREHLDEAMAAVERRYGRVDILVNNAAFGGPFHGIAATADDEWKQYLDTNITAPFVLCRRYLPGMMKRRWGRIVNIGSVMSLVGGPESAAYAATKHALVGLTKSLALEAAQSGVTVNAVCPGYIDTAMLRGNKPRGAGTPEDVAEVVARVCGDAAGYMNGAVVTVDGGLLAGLPSPR